MSQSALPLPELPAGYRIRAPELEEASRVTRLAAIADEAVGSPPTLGEDLLRQLWSRPRFSLEDDAWVLERAGEIVGYGEVWESSSARLSAFAFVHPDHTGMGLGSALAGLIEARGAARASGVARLYSAVTTGDETGARLLAGRGYGWARRFWHMELDLEATPLPDPSPDIELRQLDPAQDLPDAHRVLQEAFEDHWGYPLTSFEEFIALDVEQQDFDPGLWVIAFEADSPVGVLVATAHGDRGWIQELGVLRSHRGRGVATSMLSECFRRFQRRGLRLARVNVDSDNLTRAVSLYERVGMRVAGSYDLWTRAIGD